VALYILNNKRDVLARLHVQSGLFVTVQIDERLANGESAIERLDIVVPPPPVAPAVSQARVAYRPEDVADEDVPDDDDADADDEGTDADLEDSDDDESLAALEEAEDRDGARGGRRRRRRRGGRRGEGEAADAEVPATVRADSDDEEFGSSRRRRRGRRGGRGRDGDQGSREGTYSWVRGRTPSVEDPYVWFDPLDRSERPPVGRRNEAVRAENSEVDTVVVPEMAEAGGEVTETAKTSRRRRVRRKSPAVAVEAEVSSDEAATTAVPDNATPEAAPRPEPEAEPVIEVVTLDDEPTERALEPALAETAPEKPPVEGEITSAPEKPKRGWWRLGR